MSCRCPPVPSSSSSKDEELGWWDGWRNGWMDGKDDPPRTKPSLLYKKIVLKTSLRVAKLWICDIK